MAPDAFEPVSLLLVVAPAFALAAVDAATLLPVALLPRLLSFVYARRKPWHRPRLLCSSDDRGTGCTSWLLVVAFAIACICSASMPEALQQPFGVFVLCSCSFLQKYLLFRLFYTQKRTKCRLFCIFCAKYLAVSKKCITFAAHLKKSSARRREEPWPSL